jgi:actin related protein 2/3 complex subunit 1A/1B
VAFSPSGDALAWAAHDSSVNIAYPGQGHAVVTVRTSLLPFRTLLFATEKSIIAAGHDCAPMLFTDSGNGSWSFVDKMDKAAGKSAAGGNSAMNKFKQMDSRAQSSDSAETQLDTTHQNTVSYVFAFSSFLLPFSWLVLILNLLPDSCLQQHHRSHRKARLRAEVCHFRR